MGIVGFQGGEGVSDLKRFLCSQFLSIGVWLVCMEVYCMGTWCPQRPEEGARCPGMAVSRLVGAGNHTCVLCQSSTCSKLLSHLSGLSERLWEKPPRVGTSPVEGALTSLTHG